MVASPSLRSPEPGRTGIRPAPPSLLIGPPVGSAGRRRAEHPGRLGSPAAPSRAVPVAAGELMKFGISVSQINEVGLAVAAERAGYDFCWVWDSPMIRSNLWAVLALVADRTSTLRVGSGVAVPALRMAPVTANAIATVNA